MQVLTRWLTAWWTVLLAVAGAVAVVVIIVIVARALRRRAGLVRELGLLRQLDTQRRDDIWVVGKYRILSKLGTGGMAKVYLAEGHDRQRVALKIPDPQFFQTEEHRTYFRQELSVGKKMQHPNVVRILDYSDGSDGHVPYIAMEYVEGTTLDRKLPTARPVDQEYAAYILSRVAAALEYAHAMGVVHRDIKPENIMVSRSGDIKVADFGIARDLWDPPRDMSSTNTFVGSPHYMSPEQISCEKVDYRTDYYALGVLAFRLLTGYLPFEGDTTLEVITRKVSQHAPPPSAYNQNIPLELEQLIREMMQREPERRPVSALPIRKTLKKYLPKTGKRHGAAKRSYTSTTEDF